MTQGSNPVQRFRCMFPMQGRAWPGVTWRRDGSSLLWQMSPTAHCIVDDVQVSEGCQLIGLYVDTVAVPIERLRQLTMCPPPQRPRQLGVQATGDVESPVLTLIVRSGLGPPFVGAMLLEEPRIEGNTVVPGPSGVQPIEIKGGPLNVKIEGNTVVSPPPAPAPVLNDRELDWLTAELASERGKP